jgi:hypothetical protein
LPPRTGRRCTRQYLSASELAQKRRYGLPALATRDPTRAEALLRAWVSDAAARTQGEDVIAGVRKSLGL